MHCIIGQTRKKRDSNFSVAKKTTAQSVVFLIIAWLELGNVFQTFKPADPQVAKAEIEAIRELLYNDEL